MSIETSRMSLLAISVQSLGNVKCQEDMSGAPTVFLEIISTSFLALEFWLDSVQTDP